MIGITYMDYCLGKYEASIEKVLKETKMFPCTDNLEFIERTNYISQMSQCNTIVYEECGTHMEIYDTLVEHFLESSRVVINDIVGLFFTDSNNFYSQGVNIPFYIQHKYKMKNAAVINLNQQCSGTLAGMKLSSSLLDMEEKKYVVILTSCFMNNFSDRYYTDCLVGDGAGIIVLSNLDYQYRICGSTLKSYGELSYLKQLGSEIKISNLTLAQAYKKAIDEAIRASRIDKEAIDKIICQNTNYYFYSSLLFKMLKMDIDIIFMGNKKYGGHIGDVDIVRNLKDFTDQDNDVRYILLFAIGSYGYGDCDRSIASVVLEKV